MANKTKLQGQWLKILEARHYGNDVELTPEDLDSIIRNYQTRDDDAPVGVGRNRRDAKSLGSIVALRRDGNDLLAKIDRVAPPLEDFYQGLSGLPKVATSLKRTPKGPTLRRIGLMSEDETYPRAKDLASGVRTDAFGNDEVSFGECPTVARLKADGSWCPEFEEGGAAVILRELEKSAGVLEFGEASDRKRATAAELFATFLETIAPAVRYRGAADADLHVTAQRIARERGIPYGQALDTAVRDRAEAQFAERERGRSSNARGAELDQEARRLSRTRGISYSEALSEVAAERPDLAGR